MIKKIIILTLLLVSTNFIDAHCGGCGIGDKKEHKTHHEDHKIYDHMKKLNLTEKQQKQHKKITKKYKEEMKTLKEKYNQEIQTILTKKQKKIYTTLSEDGCKLCKLK